MFEFFYQINGIYYIIYVIFLIFFMLALLGYSDERKLNVKRAERDKLAEQRKEYDESIKKVNDAPKKGQIMEISSESNKNEDNVNNDNKVLNN